MSLVIILKLRKLQFHSFFYFDRKKERCITKRDMFISFLEHILSYIYGNVFSKRGRGK